MKILLTGRNGQLGWELERVLAPLGALVPTDRGALDLTDAKAIRAVVRGAHPSLIVNAAAYTAVDLAESEAALAHRVNAEAPAVLAEEAKRCGAFLLHYSTDYVFDGAGGAPYREDATTNPLSVYGRSKLDGERAVQASGARHLILRAGWVYGARGKNFLLTVLRLAGSRDELRIVDDQRGTPTWCHRLACISRDLLLLDSPPEGLLHATSAGDTTWHGFAVEILRLTAQTRKRQPDLHAIPTDAYPTPAARPRDARLDTRALEHLLGRPQPRWETDLARCVAALPREPQ